jgi:hypothetical protein
LQQKYFRARPEYELHQHIINAITDGFQIAYAGMKHQEHLRPVICIKYPWKNQSIFFLKINKHAFFREENGKD